VKGTHVHPIHPLPIGALVRTVGGDTYIITGTGQFYIEGEGRVYNVTYNSLLEGALHESRIVSVFLP